MRDKGSAAYQLFLLALSLYVLTVVFLETFVITDLEIKQMLQYIDFAVCLIFLLDFFVNVYTAPNKLAYLKWGWIDFIASIPMIDPFRWGRISRLVRIFRFLRTIKSLKVLLHSIQSSRLQSFSLAVALVTFMVFSLCATLILEFESGSNGGLNTANEVLWWSFLNLMNAKISIIEAQTQGGLIVTIILNKLGLLLFAYFNALIIAWLIQTKRTFKENKANQNKNPAAISSGVNTGVQMSD